MLCFKVTTTGIVITVACAPAVHILLLERAYSDDFFFRHHFIVGATDRVHIALDSSVVFVCFVFVFGQKRGCFTNIIPRFKSC